MAKPRIFVSSTYYDLKHIRNSIENFIREMGYEPILFESGDIPFKHDLTLDESCYKEIENSHMQVLIIGGKYGSPESKTPEKLIISKDKMFLFYNSITKIEYKTALDKGIPVYVFVEKQVLAEYDTYKNNRENETIKYAHVDSTNIFKLLDEIYAQRTGNYVKGFEKSDDITSWLKDQWAGLFADYLKNNQSKIEIKTLSTRINELGSITGALKEYTEAIMRKIQPQDFEKLIDEEDKKIELEKAINFQHEGMIRYIIREGEAKDSPKQLYNKFKTSKNLIEFLEKIKVNDRIKEDLLSNNKNVAERDFSEFKFRYQNIRLD
jgi:hypothetical protein